MKRNSTMFIVLFAFFIVVAIGAMTMLNEKASVFYRGAKSIGAETAVLSKTVVGDEPTADVSIPETTAETVTEAATVEATVEEVAEAAVEASSEDAGEGEGEGAGEAAESLDPRRIRYFKYTTTTTKTQLNFRKGPSEEAKIMYKLPQGTKGYVIMPGNEWCKVTMDLMGIKDIGYCSKEYLDLEEVTKDDFPEEYADLVEAPEEDLTY